MSATPAQPEPVTSDRSARGDRLRIVVGGYLGLLPAGGVTWDYVQYPLGFAGLGHDVYYIEDTCLWPIYQEDSEEGDCSRNVRHLAAVMEAFGMADRWAYRDVVTDQWFGLDGATVDEICRTADLFINVSCSTFLRDEYRAIPARVLIDSDPMFTQIQCQTGDGFTPGSRGMMDLVQAHTHHFTFGENVGAPDCRIPDCGVRWRPTRQPVCLDHWPVTPLPTADDAAFTTLMNWSAGKQLEYDGQQWGQKDVEFRKIMNLPQRVPDVPLSVAVGQTAGAPFPADEARRSGWIVLDPEQSAADWRDYHDFTERSLGEFSIAKHTYVEARTGWFSCRTACYLAAGRAAVVQDTGWTAHLPHGKGLLAFDDADSAAEALRSVVADLPKHARAAREIAEQHFDSRRVLSDMIDQIGA